MKCLTFTLLLCTCSTFTFVQLFIIVAMSSNKTIIQDEQGQYDDWIEIFNAGQSPVDLQSYFISDNAINLQKWEVTESVIIPAGGFVIFWADEDQSQ